MKTCCRCVTLYWRRWYAKPGNRDKANAIGRRWTKISPEKSRAKVMRRHLKHNYGITPAQKSNMVSEQGGKCASCGDLFKSPFHTHVDHVHGATPPKVRGILCSSCNLMLGHARDSVSRLTKGICYLKTYESR